MVVRARPLNIKEIKEDSRDVLFMDEINNECTILGSFFDKKGFDILVSNFFLFINAHWSEKTRLCQLILAGPHEE